jgi:hypothetical protein
MTQVYACGPVSRSDITCYDGCIVTFRNFSLLLACLFVAVAACTLPAQDTEITWVDNYQEALRLAKQTHKPIFLEFRCEA